MADARIEVDLGAFAHNVRTLADLVAPARTMLAVKADAYGHGMLPFARAALDAGADSLAVLEVGAGLAPARRGDQRAAVRVAARRRQRLPRGDRRRHRARRLGAVAAGGDHPAVEAPSGPWPDPPQGRHRSAPQRREPGGLARARHHAPSRPRQAGLVRIEAIWSHLADASPEDDAEALTEFHDAVAVARRPGLRSSAAAPRRELGRHPGARSPIRAGAIRHRRLRHLAVRRRERARARADPGDDDPWTGAGCARGARDRRDRQRRRHPAVGDRRRDRRSLPGSVARSPRSRSTRCRWT